MADKMKKIGIFGGSFDPPHIGHLQVALQALSVHNLDMIQVIPTLNPIDKNSSPYKHRYQMAQMAFNRAFGMGVYVQQENETKRQSFMIDTLRDVVIPTWGEDSQLFLIVGDDIDLSSWKKIDEIKEIVEGVIVIPRKEDLIGYVSSGEIRDFLYSHHNERYFPFPLGDFVPLDVMEYIEENKLYRD